MTIEELEQRRDECTDPRLQEALDRLIDQRLYRLVNPPLIMRSHCRYCGQSMTDPMVIAIRANGDGYAHMVCVEREQ